MRRIWKALKDWRHRKDAEEIERLKKALQVQEELSRRAEHLALISVEETIRLVKKLDELQSLLSPNGIKS